MSETYVLCRPRGGLNDMLCQIDLCVRYCRNHSRTLILDTSRSGLRDDFFRYFSIAPSLDAKIVSMEDVADDLDALTAYPAGVQGRVTAYESKNAKSGRKTDTQTGDFLHFDLRKPYPEQVLVYESAGGGINSFWLLQHLIPTPLVLDALRQKLSLLPASYISLHIRNTDLKTDYKTFVTRIKWALRDRDVFAATDSGEVQATLPEMGLGERQFHHLIQLDPTSNKKLHDTGATTVDSNLEMLCDLFALALGDKIYFAITEENKISGFSGLAFGLSKSKLARRVAAEIGVKRQKSKRAFRITGLGAFLQNQLLISIVKAAMTVAIKVKER